MQTETFDRSAMRVRDFWTSIVLFAASLFFLWRTSLLPFFKADAAGVESGRWYNSAALIPYFIFASLLVLSIALMVIAIRDGAARRALSGLGKVADLAELRRIVCLAIILLAYIGGLVPRVDFTISSGLLIVALIWGFHENRARPMRLATALIAVPALYAVLANFEQASWTKPHDDDFVALATLVIMIVAMLRETAGRAEVRRVMRVTPVLAILVPAFLTMAMAFGFRQNVPNRSGLLFSAIEYHYYVTLKPLFRDK
jgi:hypothetical protein